MRKMEKYSKSDDSHCKKQNRVKLSFFQIEKKNQLELVCNRVDTDIHEVDVNSVGCQLKISKPYVEHIVISKHSDDGLTSNQN